MAFRRRRFRRFRRKRGKVAKKVRTYVKRTLAQQLENKYFNVVAAATPVSNLRTIVQLNMIAQGIGASNRIGDVIKMKMIDMYFDFYYTVAGRRSATTTDYVRAILIYDRQTTNSLPAPGTILQNEVAAISYQSQMNVDNIKRFKVLYDRILPLTVQQTNTGAAADAFGVGNYFRKRVYLKNLVQQYNGGGAVVSNVVKGALYMILACSNTEVITNYQTIVYYEDA